MWRSRLHLLHRLRARGGPLRSEVLEREGDSWREMYEDLADADLDNNDLSLINSDVLETAMHSGYNEIFQGMMKNYWQEILIEDLQAILHRSFRLGNKENVEFLLKDPKIRSSLSNWEIEGYEKFLEN